MNSLSLFRNIQALHRWHMNRINYTIYIAVSPLFLILSCNKTDIPDSSDTISDFDGNTYRTIKIGTQIWMSENLNTSHYNDGIPIPLPMTDSEWESTTTGAFTTYGPTNVYGKLYNGYAVFTGKLCPPGWHIPTHDEWLTLENYLGGVDVAGGKLKSIDFWEQPNLASNSSGFSALGAGLRIPEGEYRSLNLSAFFWATNNTVPQSLKFHYIINASESINFNAMSNNFGYSCRCLSN